MFSGYYGSSFSNGDISLKYNNTNTSFKSPAHATVDKSRYGQYNQVQSKQNESFPIKRVQNPNFQSKDGETPSSFSGVSERSLKYLGRNVVGGGIGVGCREEHKSSMQDKETQFPDEEVVLSMAKRVGLNKAHNVLLLLLDHNQ